MELVKGPIQRAQKICLYGVEGIGKSYFASKFPNPIFIDTEDGTSHMDVIRTPKPSSWTMLMSQVEYFRSHPNELDTLVIDTLDWAEQLCVEHICSKNKKDGLESFGYGKGYTYLAEEFGRLLNTLNELIEYGVNVCLVAHAQMRKFEQPDEMGAYDRWEMKLQKKTAPMVKEWADMVLFANYKTYVVDVEGTKKAQGGKRVMYTTHHPCWDAKNRHDLLPEIPLDWDEIKHIFPVMNGSAVAAPKVQPEQPKKPLPQEPPAPAPAEPKSNIPKALADLMATKDVSEEEIREVVAKKGYYPINTPIENYDPQFVSGVLVGAWEQVWNMIDDNRMNATIPF